MAKNEKTQAELYREQRKARLAKAAKKNAKKQISSQGSKIAGRIIAVVLVLALVIGVGAVVVKQSGVIEKSRTAFLVGDEKISQAEYQYYYMSVYNNISYYNQMYSQYGMSYASIDTSVAPSQQDYDNSLGTIEDFPEDQTPTWADFLSYSAMESICSVKASVAAAKEMGLELTDEQKAEVETQMEDLKESAESYSENSSIKYSASAYLKANYGKGMNENLYKEILTEQKLASAFQEAKEEEFAKDFTSKEVNKEYKDNITTYGVVTFRSYTVTAETVEDEESGTSSATDETMKVAKQAADIIAAAKTEDEFKSLAADNEKANGNKDYKNYISDDTLTLQEDQSISSISVYDEDFSAWISDTDTAVGSTYVVEDTNTGYTVYMMVNPIHKAAAYETYDSRHILINFTEEETADETSDEAETAETEETDETTVAETETTTEETTAAAKEEVEVTTLDTSKYSDVTIDLGVTAETAKDKEAYKKAQDILEEYLKGDKTAAAFGTLAHEYSEDTGSNENGGLYEGTKSGDFVPPYEEWCMKDGRKEGDVGIVEYEGDNYSGYHILYFVGKDTVKWDAAVRESLAADKYNEYSEELAHGDNVARSDVNEKAISTVSDFLDGLVKNYAKNASSESAY
ncbi:MAG: peptidylprolyl isomerase [Acutalibacteraceae bacterium]